LSCCQSFKVGIMTQGFHINFGLAGQCKQRGSRLQTARATSVVSMSSTISSIFMHEQGYRRLQIDQSLHLEASSRIVRLSATQETAGMYQRGALVERVDDPRQPSCRALSAILAMRSIVAHCSRSDQIWSWPLLRRNLTWSRQMALCRCRYQIKSYWCTTPN
jgi:hypothetical protein